VFTENNTHEAYLDALYLGGLAELEALRPNVKPVIYQFYKAFGYARRETAGGEVVPEGVWLKLCKTLPYEIDKAVEVLQSADDFYLSLCAEKLKKAAKK
jgi:hypothetical protein